ncbi:CBS domain-containing protein [Streptomyces sp. NPDC006798]|uniref:CBS domain-containing protein n=1 Tax=Streptomyces sp. NPDC006798 TaxID=3155462 RepID=UPI0033DD9C49
MTRNVVRARRTTTFMEIVRLLDVHQISGVPVVDDDDKVLGVLSGSDLVRSEATWSGPAPGRGVIAADIMSSPAITVHPEQSVPDVARLMARRDVERLPVVDEEDRLIGIATRRDLLSVFLRADDEIRRQVTEEIITGALGLPPDAVVVRVRDGVVTLNGRVELRSHVPEAIRAAWRLEGVTGVVNCLAFVVDDCAQPGAGTRDRPRRELLQDRPRLRADRPSRSGPHGAEGGPSAPAAAPGSAGQ